MWDISLMQFSECICTFVTYNKDYLLSYLTLKHCGECQACWVVQSFSELHYRDSNNERHVVESMRSMLHSDKDIPVRLEAAIALQMLLKHQQSGSSCILCGLRGCKNRLLHFLAGC